MKYYLIPSKNQTNHNAASIENLLDGADIQYYIPTCLIENSEEMEAHGFGNSRALAEVFKERDTLRQQLAEANELREKAEREVERLQKIEKAARGLSFGTDWNKGTHAKKYRPILIEALNPPTADSEKGVDNGN